MRFSIDDIPGVVDVDPLELAYQHSFHFTIPREYPQNLGDVKIFSETCLYHPRMGSAGGRACYSVNGEIDRLLVDLIYNVLLRPETVRPPSQFQDADWGLNAQKMRWYIEYGPQKIHRFLKREWGKRQKKKRAAKSNCKVQILDG